MKRFLEMIYGAFVLLMRIDEIIEFIYRTWKSFLQMANGVVESVVNFAWSIWNGEEKTKANG